jgi:hypothetical protein
MSDQSPHLNCVRVSNGAEIAAHKIIRHRMSKEEYEEVQRKKRNPKYKKSFKP